MTTSSPFSLSRPTARRLAAGLCLTACGGFLVGTLRERWEAARSPVPVASHPPSAPGIPGDVMAGNPFTAPAAQGMEAGDYERALGNYRAALIDAQTSPARMKIAGQLHALGVSAHMRDKGEGRVSIAALEEAVVLYREEKATPLSPLANTLADLADAVCLRGDRQRMNQLWDEAVAISMKSGDETLQAEIGLRAGDFYRGRGEYARGEQQLTKALRHFRNYRDKRGVAHSLRYLGGIDVDKGRFKEARQQLTESARLLGDIGEVETRAAVLGTLGDAWLRDGNSSAAIPLYQEGLAVWQSRRQRFWTAVFLSRLGNVAFAQNDLSQAESLGLKSLRMLDDSNGVLARNAPLHLLGNVARKRGEFPKAVRLYEKSLALRRKAGNPRAIAEGCEALAAALMSIGDSGATRRAKELVQEARERRKSYGFHLAALDSP